jgi:hypothetical protein
VFPLPLPSLFVRYKDNARQVDEVFISYGQTMEGFAISDIDDRYVQITPRKRTDFLHREEPHFAYLLTDFEAEQLSRVCDGFVRALTILERDLQARRWDRCLHMDGALPRFMRGFYCLVNAARRSRTALPPSTCIPDSLYGDSLRSDLRIDAWRRNPERVMKLRIAIKELVYRTRQWQQSELDNPRRDKWNPPTARFGKAYELFVKIYFGFIN